MELFFCRSHARLEDSNTMLGRRIAVSVLSEPIQSQFQTILEPVMDYSLLLQVDLVEPSISLSLQSRRKK